VTRAGSLTFAAGVKTLSFTVPTIANTLVQPGRTVNLTLGPAVTGTGGAILGPQSSAVLTIVDNDAGGAIRFSAAAYTVSEASAAATITLVRSGGIAGPVTVDFATLDGVGTATAGVDYTSVAQTVTFAAGVTTRSVTIPILTDTRDEPNETIALQLSNPGGGATLGPQSTATLTIVDNDVAGTVQFGQVLYSVNESATSATITITRSGGTASAVTVDFATSNGPGPSGAVAGTHYTATATTITFALNQVTQSVVVPLNGENANGEGNKFVTLALSNPGGGATLGARSSALLRIVDNGLSLAFSATSYTVRENGAAATITVELTGVNVTPVTVNWATSNGTATAGADYGTRGSAVPPAGVLTFAAGGTPTAVRTRTFTVPILQDTVVEVTKTVNLTLSAPVGAPLAVGRNTAALLITDDD
jgi:hypothetical protein